MEWKYIETKSGVCGGKPCFKGTRIPVYIILQMMGAGDTTENILREYPQLTRDHILEALRFAAELANFEEILLIK